MKVRRPTWLWWIAFLITLTGGSIAYLLSLQEANPDAHTQMVLTIAISSVLVGICLIVLSADWWMRH